MIPEQKGVWANLQSAVNSKLTEAEQRRRALQVYEKTPAEAAEIEAQKEHAAELRRSRISLLCGISLVFALCMGYMLLNTQVTVIGYEINRQMAANNDLANDNTRLLLEIEQATSPEKVASFAMEHFNMVTATEDSVIYYDAGAVYDDAPAMRTGMAVDEAVLGFGTVEVLAETEDSGFIQTFGNFWQQITSGGGIQLGMKD